MNPENRSYEADLPLLHEIENTHDLHMATHELIARIAAELSQVKHQRIPYGEIPSMLHLHMLCHALNKNTRIYVTLDGQEHSVVRCHQRVDSIGRMDSALVLECE